jgi:hypothetical protein
MPWSNLAQLPTLASRGRWVGPGSRPAPDGTHERGGFRATLLSRNAFSNETA